MASIRTMRAGGHRPTGAQAQQQRILVRELGMLARMIDPDVEAVTLAQDGPAAAWSDGKNVVLNQGMLPAQVNTARGLANWLGALYHEMGHSLFTGTVASPLGKMIVADRGTFPKMWHVYNVAEDARVERSLIGRWRRMTAYLTTVVLDQVLADIEANDEANIDSSWPLVCGRTWLPDKVRRHSRARWVATRGAHNAARIASLIGEYQGIRNPAYDSPDRAYAILRELYVLMAQNPDDGGTDGDGDPGTDGGTPEWDDDNLPEHKCGHEPHARDGKVAAPVQAENEVPTAADEDDDLGTDDDEDDGGCDGYLPGTDEGDEEGEPEGTARGTGQGDDEGTDDGDDDGTGQGDGDGEGDGTGQGDDEGTDGGDGEGTGDGTAPDSDTAGDQAEGAKGAGGGEADGRLGGDLEPEHIDPALDGVAGAIEKAYDDMFSDPRVAEELERILDASVARDQPQKEPQKSLTWHRPGEEARNRVDSLTENLRHLRADTRSEWVYGVADGELNVDRYYTPGTSPDHFFNEWRADTFEDTDVQVVALFDTSGSMGGQRGALIEALWIMHQACDAAQVKFTALSFDSTWAVLVNEDVEAQDMMRDVTIGGSTQPREALQYAYDLLRQVEHGTRLCMILSDGSWDDRSGEPIVEALNAAGVDTVAFLLSETQYGTAQDITQSEMERLAYHYGHGAQSFYIVATLDALAIMVERLVTAKLEAAQR